MCSHDLFFPIAAKVKMASLGVIQVLMSLIGAQTDWGGALWFACELLQALAENKGIDGPPGD